MKNSDLRRWRIGVMACLAVTALQAGPAVAGRDIVRNAKSWSIQLQGNGGSIAKRNTDVAVVDPDEVRNPAKLKKKASGGKRAVLAYVSIGEAEEVPVLHEEEQEQALDDQGTQGWKATTKSAIGTLSGRPSSNSRSRPRIDAGYDGVYLDRVDTYESV